MGNINVDNIKKQLLDLTERLETIKGKAKSLEEEINSGKILSVDTVSDFSTLLRQYQTQYKLLCDDGSMLSLSTFSTITQLKAAINAYEESIQFEEEREIIKTYFMLQTDDSSFSGDLLQSKLELMKKCYDESTIKDTIEPYKIVVSTVRNSLELLESSYDLITAQIGKQIARAVDKEKLIIDADADISAFMDNSCLLLSSSLENQEDNIGENSGEPLTDGSDILTDDTTVSELAKGIMLPSDEVLQGTSSESAYQFDGIITPPEFAFVDVPASELSVSRIKNICKENPLIPFVLSGLSRIKIFDESSKSDNINCPNFAEICEVLISEGLITKASVCLNRIEKDVFVLTSKGSACFENPDTNKIIEDSSVLLAKKLRQPSRTFSDLFVSQSLLIKQYIDYANLTQTLLVGLSDVNHFAYSTAQNELEKEEYIFAAVFDNSESFNALIDGINTLPEGNYTFVFKSENDSQQLKKKLENQALDVHIKYAIIDDDGAFYIDSNDIIDTNPKKDDETNNEENIVAWENIGIPNYEDLIYHPRGLKIECFESSKASKPFGVKELKSDLKKLPDTKRAVHVLQALNFGMITTPKLVSVYNDEQDYDYTSYCERLYDLGYISKMVSDGAAIYFVNSRGRKIYCSKDATSFFDLKYNENSTKMAKETYTERNYLSRNMLVEGFSNTLAYYNDSLIDGCQLSLDENEFTLFCKKENGISYMYLCSFTDNPQRLIDSFTKATDKLSKVNVLVVMGYNYSQAKAMCDLAFKIFGEKLSSVQVDFYDFEKNALHNYSSDNPIVESDNSSTVSTDEASELSGSISDLSDEDDSKDDELTTVTTPASKDTIIHNNDAVNKSTSDIGAINEVNARDCKNEKVTRALIVGNLDNMLKDGEYYCATAYLAACAKKYSIYKNKYNQLAYALNDPLCECVYSSKKIFDVFFDNEGDISDYQVTAATLRNFFSDHSRYDYEMQSLFDAIKENHVCHNDARIKSVLRNLMEFKGTNGHGLDYYADYRVNGTLSFESNLMEICHEAKSLSTLFVESAGKDDRSFRRLIETKKILFSRNSDIYQMLSYVAENDSKNLDIIQLFLTENFIRDNCEIRITNIDESKIDDYLERAWDKAQDSLTHKKSNINLIGAARQTALNRIKESANILCKYCEISTANSAASESGYIAYKKIKAGLLADIKECIQNCNGSDMYTSIEMGDLSVLKYTLEEIQSKIEGTYREENCRYFYLPFLQSEYVLLDDSYLPILDIIEELPRMCADERVLQHYCTIKISLPEMLDVIFSGEDDYGSARLIVQYLANHPSDNLNIEDAWDNLNKGVVYPRNNIEAIRKGFADYLELAQSYGQFDSSAEGEKETMLQIVDDWYEKTLETENFGFFSKIIESFKEKIIEDSICRGEELSNNLDSYKDSHKDWDKDELINDTVVKIQNRINCQNYSAAEDLINRLQNNDIEPATTYIEKDYLEDFITNYSDYSKLAGKAGSSFDVKLNGYNKENKGGQNLINNWPHGKGFSAGKLRDLLIGLGFDVDNIDIKEQIQGKMDNFFVRLKKPINGRKINYKHPISIFGSEAVETDFRVVCIYGTQKPEALVDLFKEIGDAKNTIVFLEYSMLLPERRELARRTKNTNIGKTFIVIDRVVITYLAKNYQQTSINRTLMSITLPFSYYQPYVPESSKVMPPEIFMGRKNELNKIESPNGVNIVYGGRQLGKSALLRMAQNDIDRDENGNRAILIDIKGNNYKDAARKVSEELYDQYVLDEPIPEEKAEDWSAISRALKKVLRDGNSQGKIPYLLLLLDEADVFIESCEEINYAPFDALKDVQSIGAGRFKFVVAGLKNVVKFKKDIALNKNSVLTHLSALTVTPFKTAEARELLEVPLSYLGFRFPDNDITDMLISNIFGTTNYFPGLLQLYCSKLIEAMKDSYAGYDEYNTPPYEIREEHIKKVLADKSLEEQIKEKFIITLKVDNDDYYYQLALLVAFYYHNNNKKGCSVRDIHDTAESYGLRKIAALTLDQIKALVEEMIELNVFQLVGNDRYRFARHSFCNMMGSTQEIDEEMLRYAE